MYRKFTKTEIIKSAVLIILLLNQIVQGQEKYDKVISTIIQIPKELHLEDRLYEDINQDGLKDFVLSVSNRTKFFERSLRIYYQQDNSLCFKMEPDEIITLTSDVIAFACADLDRNPGSEILLFTDKACFGYRLYEESKDKIFKIAEIQFLWQIPDPYTAFSWQDAVLDFNNDGRLDLVIPQSDGYRILFQKGSEFISSPLLKIPKEYISDGSNVRLNRNRPRFSMSGSFENRNNAFDAKEDNKPLVKVDHSVNVPVFTDFDGDNRNDIVIQTSKYINVWKQEENEPFFTNQYIRLNIPNEGKDNEETDIAGNQYVSDLNRDRYFDFIMSQRDKTAKKVFTQILIYLNEKNSNKEAILFNEQGVPQQLIKIAGLPGDWQFEDINGDGYPDLSFITFNPDLLDQVETLTSKSIKLQFLSFINDKKGCFSRNPDINHEFNVLLEQQNQSGIELIRFFTDFDNDGLLDVLVRDKNNHIGLHLLSKTKSVIKILNKSVWDMTIPEKARIVFEKTKSDMKDVLIITSPDQVMYVRFK
jgi:hypothetical protein